MRVATNSVSDSVIAQIQKLSVRQSQLQTQISTGQRISQPGDDPAAMARVLALQNEQVNNGQFQANGNRALDVSNATYSGLQDIKTISDRAGEIATLGAGAASPDAFAAYSKEVNQLVEQAVQLGNVKFGNDYLFSGTAVTTAPIVVAGRNSSNEITGVTYAGNSSQSSIQLSESSSIAPSTTGATNTGLKDFVNNLIALRDALKTASGTAVSAAQPALDTSENLLVNSLSEQGAIQLRVEVAQKQQTSRGQDIEKLISNEADADIAATAVQLSQTSTAYQGALSSAAKILQMSLLDYLK